MTRGELDHGRRRWVAGARLRGGELAGESQSGAPVADSGRSLALEHACSMANPSGNSGLRIAARLGARDGAGGASSSARPTRCSRRRKGPGNRHDVFVTLVRC